MVFGGVSAGGKDTGRQVIINQVMLVLVGDGRGEEERGRMPSNDGFSRG